MIAIGKAHPYEDSTSIERALDKLRVMISRRFPAAEFFVTTGDDPEGVHLHAVVDVEDLDEVTEVVVSRLVDMQVDEGIPVYVFPRRQWTAWSVEAREKTAASPAPLIPVVPTGSRGWLPAGHP